MALTVGSRLGHYDVTALIGEGGMGQVYQATDSAHIDAGPEDGQRRRPFMTRNPWLVLVLLFSASRTKRAIPRGRVARPDKEP